MDRYEFHRQLKLLARAGALRVSELAVWFEQPRSTVAAWATGMRLPGEVIWPGVLVKAQLLYLAIYKYRQFPIPADVHFKQRKRYVQQCLANAHNPVSKGVAPRDRVQMRLGTRARRVKAPTVGGFG